MAVIKKHINDWNDFYHNICDNSILIGILTKRILYINEHVQSIENELYIFNDNFETIKSIDKTSDFDLGSGHLYG